MANIYRVILIKLNQLVCENVDMITVISLTYQQSEYKLCHSDRYFSELLPTGWRQK